MRLSSREEKELLPIVDGGVFDSLTRQSGDLSAGLETVVLLALGALLLLLLLLLLLFSDDTCCGKGAEPYDSREADEFEVLLFDVGMVAVSRGTRCHMPVLGSR